jgi:hypothetical protein
MKDNPTPFLTLDRVKELAKEWSKKQDNSWIVWQVKGQPFFRYSPLNIFKNFRKDLRTIVHASFKSGKELGQLNPAQGGSMRKHPDFDISTSAGQKRLMAVSMGLPSETYIGKLIDLSHKGDHGADPLGDGRFRMIPSGDIVSLEERNERLKQRNPARGGSMKVNLVDKNHEIVRTFTAKRGRLPLAYRHEGVIYQLAVQSDPSIYIEAYHARNNPPNLKHLSGGFYEISARGYDCGSRRRRRC